MKGLTTSIIQKVKDELGITEDLPSIELYDLLHKHRNLQHPDKFADEERKKDAEEKFKRLNELLNELSKYIELEKQQKKPSDIIPYQKDYEIVKSKQQAIDYEAKIKELQLINDYKDREIKTLRKEIASLQKDKVEEKTNDLIKHYKPSKKSLISQGIAFLVALVVGVLTKIDEVAIVLSKYFPFDPIYLNYFIFGILVFIPLRFITQYFLENKIDKAAKRIRTPLFNKKFLNYLSEKDIKDYFTEMNVYDFLQTEFASKNSFSKTVRKYIYNVYSETSINSLKDIFIFNLLSKQLITISDADQLDRKFRIAKSVSHPY